MYRKIYPALINLEHFNSIQFTTENDNFKKLATITPQEEKKIFFTDSLFETSFEKIMLNTVYGVRKLMGDPRYPTKQDIAHNIRCLIIPFIAKIFIIFETDKFLFFKGTTTLIYWSSL